MPKCRLFFPKKNSLPNELRNTVLSNLGLGISIGVISKHMCPEYSSRLENAKEDLKGITLDGLYADPNITGWSFYDNGHGGISSPEEVHP